MFSGVQNQQSKPKPHLWFVGAVGFGLICQTVWGLGIVVNEFSATDTKLPNGAQMAPDEYIEFLITAPSTASELAGLSFGSSNHTTNQIETAFVFDFTTLSGVLNTAGLSAFLPGTLIVVKGDGLGAQNTTYNPLAATASDSDAWSIELTLGQGFLMGLNGPTNKSMDLDASKGALVYIAQGIPVSKTDTSGFIDALGVDTNPGRIASDAISQFGATAVLSDASNSGNIAVNRGDAATGTAPGFNVPTMGEPESTGPTAVLVQDFRTNVVPEPSRMLLLLGGLLFITLRRARSATFGGSPS